MRLRPLAPADVARLVAWAQTRAAAQGLAGVSLATFRDLPWNGLLFRRLGLAAILARHATFLDMSLREALWKPVAPGPAGAAA